MGVYSRYKRDPGGFRKLVELLETTPKARRDRMIEVGMEEDPEYTQKALEYMMSFEDVLNLPDMEMAELVAKAPTKMTAMSIRQLGKEIQEKFIKNALPAVASEIKDFMEIEVSPREVGGAQLKLVATARELEKSGFIRTKRIPA